MSCRGVSDSLSFGFCKNDCTFATTKYYAVALIVASVVILAGCMFFGLINFVPVSALPQGLAFIATQIGHGGSIALVTIGSVMGTAGTVAGVSWFIGSSISREFDDTNRDKDPLILAAKNGDVVEIERLVKGGHDINVIASTGYTPLFEAIFHNNPQAIKALLAHGALTSLTVNHTIVDALFYAVYNDAGEAVRVLVDHGENINKMYQGSSLCHWAVSWKLNALKALLEKGANTNTTDLNGKTPLRLALDRGPAEACKLLSSYSAPLTFKKTNRA